MSDKIRQALSQSKFIKKIYLDWICRSDYQCGQEWHVEIRLSARPPNYKLHHAYSKILEINHSEKCHNKSVNFFELKVTYLILQMWDSAFPMQWLCEFNPWFGNQDPTCLVAKKKKKQTKNHKIGCNRSESSVSLLTYLNNRELGLGLYSAISMKNQQWLKHIKICLSQETRELKVCKPEFKKWLSKAFSESYFHLFLTYH